MQNYQELALAEIRPSPLNPRKINDQHPSLGPMAESIQAVGLIQPIVVRPINADAGSVPHVRPRYEIVAGERRWRACRKAKLATIAALVRELDDAQALEVIVVENLQREDLTPLEEAAGVQSLLDAGWDAATVADHLGRPRAWVVKRARLQSLSAEWRKQIGKAEGPLRGWSASHLELVARLDPAGQDNFYREHAANLEWIGQWNVQELHARLADWTRKLRSAPWKLDDALLVPAAGACTACPKRSSCTPGLFDEESEEEVTKEDRCLDTTCWKTKLVANAELKYEDLKAKHPDLVLIRDGYGSGKDRALTFHPKLVESAKLHYEVTPARKSDKGAVPALVVCGPTMGTVQWVKGGEEGKSQKAKGKTGTAGRGDGEAATGPQKSLAERREALDKRRKVQATDAIREAIERQVGVPTIEELIPVLIAGGTEHRCNEPGVEAIDVTIPGDNYTMYRRDWHWSIVDKLAKVVEKPHWPKYLWAQIKPVLCRRLRYAGNHVPIGPLWLDAQRSAQLAGLDAATFYAAACEAIPEPKSWANLEEEEAAAKSKGKSKKAKTGKAASHVGG